MSKLTGSCLCGQVTLEADGEIKNMANCHCTDCRKSTGAAYATLVFMMKDDVTIKGETQSYAHKSDRGSDMTKYSCPNCGSPMFGENSAREGMYAIRAGFINEKDEIVPKFNVYMSSAIASTPIDDTLPHFDKLPG